VIWGLIPPSTASRGAGVLGLGLHAVLVRVPDFGERFWVLSSPAATNDAKIKAALTRAAVEAGR
jgi:hypothetical protein